MQEAGLSCLLFTFKVIVWFFWVDFDLPPSSPNHALLSVLPSQWVKDFQKEISQQGASPQINFWERTPFLQLGERTRSSVLHPPSKILLQAQHRDAASHLWSAQNLHTGKCLSEDSSCPLHSWLKIHFKTSFIYILITSAITITLPLLRNCSTACRSPMSEPEISENGGLQVCRLWVLLWKDVKSHRLPWDVLLF